MHAIYELLPLMSGMLIARFYYFIKAIPLRNTFILLAGIFAGSFVNWLSGEGLWLVTIDIALTWASAIAFLMLTRAILLYQKY